MKFFLEIDVEQVKTQHRKAIERYGGSAGIIDERKIESALNFLYLDQFTIPQIAGKLAYRILVNHAFEDGNKRTALLSAQLFLKLNGFRYTAREHDSIEIFIGMAKGEKSELDCMAHFDINTEKRC